jgi:hypothetical protein
MGSTRTRSPFSSSTPALALGAFPVRPHDPPLLAGAQQQLLPVVRDHPLLDPLDERLAFPLRMRKRWSVVPCSFGTASW